MTITLHPSATRALRAALLAGTLFAAATVRAQHLHVTGTDVEVDIHGAVYVMDSGRNTLRKYEAAGDPSSETGGTGWNPGRFDGPSGVWARNGIDVFVADYGNHRVQRFDRTLSFVSSLSTRDERSPAEGGFGYPMDVAVSRQGDLFVCDGENAQVVKVNRFSKVEYTFGGFGAGRGRLHEPRKIDVGPADAVYVLDRGAVTVFDAFGSFLLRLGEGMFRTPFDLVADELGVLVGDSTGIHWFDADHRPRRNFGWAEFVIDGSSVRSFAAGGGTIVVLTSSGVFRSADPRAGDLDKPAKTP